MTGTRSIIMSLELIQLVRSRLRSTCYCAQAGVAIHGRSPLRGRAIATGALTTTAAVTGKVKGRMGGTSRSAVMAVNHVNASESTSKLAAGVWTDSGVNGGLVLPAESAHVDEAAKALKSSQVVAVPTDTLYGFACDACSEAAIRKIYDIKGRSATRPLAICLAEVQEVERYGTIEHLPHGLLEALFPGPVTLILPRGDGSLLDKALNPGLPSIGVRIPDDPFIRSLCRAMGGALALTSANLSSQPSTVTVEEFRHLWGHCSIVFDAGRLPAGRAGSTIVDLTGPGMSKIVRDGSALRETCDVLVNFGLSERIEDRTEAA